MQMRQQVIILFILCSALVASADAQTGEEWFEIGSAHFDNSSFTEAIQAWEKAMQVDSSLSANSWYNIGLAYAGMEKYEEAIRAWDNAIRIAPDSPVAYDNKGTALAILGRNDEAIVAYNNAIRLDPENLKFKADRDMLVESMKSTKTPLSPVLALFAILTVSGSMLLNRRRP